MRFIRSWFSTVSAAACIALMFCTGFNLYSCRPCHAEIYDRVVAFVDNQAITLSEFREQFSRTREVSADISEDEVLDTMINRLLFLREAKRYRLEALNQDELVKEFISLKIRAFIRISEQDIEGFYKNNSAQFQGRDYEDARDEIEYYLTEKELNIRLKNTIKDLRKNAYIRVRLHAPEK